jgi:hypothetical protein
MAAVRDAIAAQAVNGMSFRFSVVREMWETPDGKPIRDEDQLMAELRRTWYDDIPDEELLVRTLKELKVPELGPVTWPAYSDTSVSVRSRVIDLGRLNDPEQRKLLAEAVFIADAASQDDDSQRSTAPAVGERQSNDAQQDADPVVERPSTKDAQRSTPDVGERPSKTLSRNALLLRNQRDTLINMKKKGQSL